MLLHSHSTRAHTREFNNHQWRFTLESDSMRCAFVFIRLQLPLCSSVCAAVTMSAPNKPLAAPSAPALMRTNTRTHVHTCAAEEGRKQGSGVATESRGTDPVRAVQLSGPLCFSPCLIVECCLRLPLRSASSARFRSTRPRCACRCRTRPIRSTADCSTRCSRCSNTRESERRGRESRPASRDSARSHPSELDSTNQCETSTWYELTHALCHRRLHSPVALLQLPSVEPHSLTNLVSLFLANHPLAAAAVRVCRARTSRATRRFCRRSLPVSPRRPSESRSRRVSQIKCEQG